MPRINSLSLDQINRQVDIIDSLSNQVNALQTTVAGLSFQTAVADPIHAPTTTNNLVFTWTGGTTTLSWADGWVKSKNWNAQTTSPIPAKSSAPGVQHSFNIPAGSLSLSPSTSYWLGWDSQHQTLQASTDASKLQGNHNVHVICQITTGPASQTAVIGGGGSNGTSDVSGISYPNTQPGSGTLTVVGGGFTKIQAGSSSVNSGATISFPTTFTTLVAVTIGNYGGSANITSSSTSGFVIATSSNPQRIDWIAVGT